MDRCDKKKLLVFLIVTSMFRSVYFESGQDYHPENINFLVKLNQFYILLEIKQFMT